MKWILEHKLFCISLNLIKYTYKSKTSWFTPFSLSKNWDVTYETQLQSILMPIYCILMNRCKQVFYTYVEISGVPFEKPQGIWIGILLNFLLVILHSLSENTTRQEVCIVRNKEKINRPANAGIQNGTLKNWRSVWKTFCCAIATDFSNINWNI